MVPLLIVISMLPLALFLLPLPQMGGLALHDWTWPALRPSLQTFYTRRRGTRFQTEAAVRAHGLTESCSPIPFPGHVGLRN